MIVRIAKLVSSSSSRVGDIVLRGQVTKTKSRYHEYCGVVLVVDCGECDGFHAVDFFADGNSWGFADDASWQEDEPSVSSC